MEITITTRPAGSEQRAASSRRSSSQQHRPFWQNRDVGLFGPSLEALKLLFPRIHHLMFSLFCGKSLLNPPDCFYTADPRNQLEIKKEFTTTTCSDSPVGFSCACFLCFNFTVLLCYWAFINCWCRRTHHSFYKCVHPYYWELYCTSNITPLTDTLTIV